jgi:hypothetical protein
MLMDGDGAAGQRASPLHRFDLQAQVVELHRVVAIHHPPVLQRKDAFQILPCERHEGAAGSAAATWNLRLNAPT